MKSENPEIKPMNEEDITKVFDIERKSFPYPFGEILIGNIFFGAPELCFVMESQNEIIGFVLGGYTTVQGQTHILSIALLEEYRNKGWGRDLLIHFIKRTEILGYKSIKLEVQVDNDKAIQLYDTLGFDIISRIRKYYQDDSDAFLMVRS